MIITYFQSTGEIIHAITTHTPDTAAFYENEENWQPNQGSIITQSNIEALEILHSCFVQNKRLVERPLMPLLRTHVQFAAGETHCVEGVPKGAMVNFDGVQGLCDDGVVELHATVPGQYQLAIEKWPFLDGTIDVTVTEAGA